MKSHAITGVGIVSPIGVGRNAFFEAMRSGTCAQVRGRELPIESFDASAFEGASVVEVPRFDATKYLGERGLRTLDRLSKLAIVAARLALHDAGLKKDNAWELRTATAGEPLPPWSERVGIVLSNAYGSLEAISELDRVALLEDARYINPSRFPLTVSNTAAGYVGIWEDLRALNVSVSDGNCGGLDAIACADLMLECARADVLLVGGAEAMSAALCVAFARLGLGSKNGPHGGSVDGVRLGEGAALLAVETAEGANARGAQSLAEVGGFGTSFEGPRSDASLLYASPNALEQAIRNAIGDASVSIADIDLVVSGASGIPPFDRAEAVAIERVFGPDVCVVAPKLAFGETLGAGGAMGVAAAVAYLREGVQTHRVRGQFRGPVRGALVTSLGYHGNASALVLRAAPR